jgi:hypothetical protein
MGLDADIDALRAPTRYDLNWLGSVATHLSAENVERLLDVMLSWTITGGPTLTRVARGVSRRS